MTLPTCDARLKSDPSKRCKKPVVAGRNRCRLHGGLSTGPRTAEGLATCMTNLQAGRKAWIEARREAGLTTFGRKKGATNLSTRRYEAALAQWQADAAAYDHDRDAHAEAVFDAVLAKVKHIPLRSGGEALKHSFASAKREEARRSYPPLPPPPQRKDFRSPKKKPRVRKQLPSRAALVRITETPLTPVAQAPLPPPPSETLEARLTREGWTYDRAVNAWSRQVGPAPPPPIPVLKGWP